MDLVVDSGAVIDVEAGFAVHVGRTESCPKATSNWYWFALSGLADCPSPCSMAETVFNCQSGFVQGNMMCPEVARSSCRQFTFFAPGRLLIYVVSILCCPHLQLF